MADKRPDPKPRKNPQLWQAYLWWDELTRMRQRHMLRISSIERGKSYLDAGMERAMMDDLALDACIGHAQHQMAEWGKAVGPIWDWMTSIKGIGDHTAAKILALIDDVGKFETRSKLYRFAGLAVIGGGAEPKDSTHYCRKLKAYLVGPMGLASQFLMHAAYPYADHYYLKREEDRRKHPDVVCKQCGCQWEKCEHKKQHKRSYNDGHMDLRAKRKIAKLFLSHLWEKWREYEGLPVPPTYAEAVLGHSPVPVP
jgi:hypothetical protein